MSAIQERTFKRKCEEDNRAGPPILKVSVYDLKGSCPENCFELRGEDEQGRVHFSFRDPRRLVVLDEFDMTLSDLESHYDMVSCGFIPATA
jgi:hypothetical protein